MAQVYAVASAKGGVGKTTTTANLGALLADAGVKVVVIDADVGMANLASTLGVEADGATLHDVLAGRAEPLDAAYAGPRGMVVVPGETALDAYADADPERLREVVAAFEDAAVVLIDGAAGLSLESALPLGIADEVLLVATPEQEALVDTGKTEDLTMRLGGTIAGLALTRVDDPSDSLPDVSDVVDAEILEAIPEDPEVRRAAAAGEPLATYAPSAPATIAYRKLATTLTDVHFSEDDLKGDESESEDPTGEATEVNHAGAQAPDRDGESDTDHQLDQEADEGDGESTAGEGAITEAEPTRAASEDNEKTDGDDDVEDGPADDLSDADSDENDAEPEATSDENDAEPEATVSDGDAVESIPFRSSTSGTEDTTGITVQEDDDDAVGPDDSDDESESAAESETETNEQDDDVDADVDSPADDGEVGGVTVDVDDAEETADADENREGSDADNDDGSDPSADANDDDSDPSADDGDDESDVSDDEGDDETEQKKGFFSRLLGR